MRQLMEQKKSTDQAPDLGSAGLGPPPSGASILRRNNRGCKSKDFYNWPEQPFEEMDSPLAVQQYIQQVINRNPADIDEILRLPEGQDLGAWKIEHLRLFCMQLNRLAAKLQDCCFPETCNQMTATEQWIFLCAAHKQPNECPAIDYTRHTLDGAASLLNSNKYFPSRVTIKDSSVAKLGSVCRRVYRIFSHAYYHHFQIFDDFERETHLCKRFSKFVTMYELMPKDSLIVPADGSKPEIDIEKTTVGSNETTVMDGTATSDSASQQPTAESAAAASPIIAAEQPETPHTETNEKESEPKVKLEPVETNVTPSIPTTATVKAEPKTQSPKSDSKKTNANPTTKPTTATTTTPSQQPKSTTWTPSAMSTNTMVKSSPNARSDAKKQQSIDSENNKTAANKSHAAAPGEQASS